MKTVFSNSDVAHKFANQSQEEGRNSQTNFYFEGDTIYSYGRHFPIATHCNGVILFTERKYSNTTAKHILEVRSATSHIDKIYCFNPFESKNGNHSGTINYFIGNILQIAKNLAKAKKPEKYLSEIEGQKMLLAKYTNFFKIKLSKEEAAKIKFSTTEEFIEAQKKANKAAAAEVLRAEKNGKRLFGLWGDFFRANKGSENEFLNTLNQKDRGDIMKFRSDANQTFLCVAGDYIKTSKNVKIPVAVAQRYFEFYKRILAAGGCDGNCNYKMMDYTVSYAGEKGLTVGCHSIAKSEIDLIATKLNWTL